MAPWAGAIGLAAVLLSGISLLQNGRASEEVVASQGDRAMQTVVPAVEATSGREDFDGADVGIDDHVSTIVTAQGLDLDIYDAPGGAVTRTLRSADVLTVPGATPLVMLTTATPEEQRGGVGWYEVYLPVRPNGSTGWVRSDEVEDTTTTFWMQVDLSAFELTVYDGSEAVLSTSIGVGREDLPTPGGIYYVKELLRVPDPGGVYGPYAYGLSGYQSELDTFNGGQAVIGIHGTNDATSFGRVVSSGCIRTPNDVITRLAEQISPPLGTPVRILE